jgi:uncharacterized protein (DUF488 family)
VALVADVRRHPGSRRHPQYDRAVLRDALPGYVHLPELGGRRRARADSPNAGWTHAAFRGYADHMATDAFARGLERLERLAAGARTAVMCAEAAWWRCHRRLLADALLARGWAVRHIGPDGRLTDHALPPFALVDGTTVTYPPAQLPLDADPGGGA